MVMRLPKPYYEDEARGIVIYYADCRYILPLLPKVDLLLTDPPYGIGAYKTGTMGGGVLAKQSRYDAVKWDDTPADKKIITAAITSAANAIIWGGNYFWVPPSPCWLVWDKDNGANNFADCELAYTTLPTAVRLFKHKWQGMLQQDMKNKDDRNHPTQKPLALMKWCLGFFPKAETVLDPFMGSGTTLVACKQLGRKCIGIELEEKYCEIAARRLAQDNLFAPEELASLTA